MTSQLSIPFQWEGNPYGNTSKFPSSYYVGMSAVSSQQASCQPKGFKLAITMGFKQRRQLWSVAKPEPKAGHFLFLETKMLIPGMPIQMPQHATYLKLYLARISPQHLNFSESKILFEWLKYCSNVIYSTKNMLNTMVRLIGCRVCLQVCAYRLFLAR